MEILDRLGAAEGAPTEDDVTGCLDDLAARGLIEDLDGEARA